MNFSERQRAEVVRLLSESRPDAPTIAGTWTAHDLAAHLWVRENDVLSLPGIGLRAFAPLTDARMERAKQRYAYSELIRRIAHPPIWTKPMAIANEVEYFVHRLDILRADHTLEYTRPTSADEDLLWRRVRLIGRRLRRIGIGVVLERSDTGGEVRVSPGNDIVTVLGMPSELIMFLTGRVEHADVCFVGASRTVATVREHHLSI